MPGIRRLNLDSFKAFKKFRVPFAPRVNLLVGPNNAGKSTIISALRTAGLMIRLARRSNVTQGREIGDEYYNVHYFDSAQLALEVENLRFDFQDVDTRMEVEVDPGLLLRACWPASPDAESFFFFVEAANRTSQPKRASHDCPSVAILPLLTPIDHREPLLTADHVAKNLTTRLASRHLRNQLLLLTQHGNKNETVFDEFRDFVAPWLSELTLETPEVREGTKNWEVHLFYREGRFSREIAWAGDGIQVYLQLLLQIFRARGSDVIILDEPDVYLHADLQRRLLRLLATLDCQVILSTHSAEMVAEAPPESVVWIDRSRTGAIRSPEAAALTELSTAIGSQFNLRLARVLRARVALFVEGKDMTVLRILAEKLGATRIVSETGVAVVPLEGSANWRRLLGFEWLANKLLRGAVQGYVILDRDFHTEAGVDEVIRQLRDSGLACHVWMRHELESYVLVLSTIARVTDLPEDRVLELLTEATDELRGVVLGGMVDTRFSERRDRRVTPGPLAEECGLELDNHWSNIMWRLEVCPAKETLSGLNRRLQAEGRKATSIYGLATAMHRDEVAREMAEVLRRVDTLAGKS